jgi:hypothetical protein
MPGRKIEQDHGPLFTRPAIEVVERAMQAHLHLGSRAMSWL